MSSVKILFIGGAGRSGSTLLETLLAQVDGIVSVGEFNEVWKAGVLENRLCGCGRRFHDCDFWRSVFDVSFGGLSRVDVNRAIAVQDGSCRIRHIPQMAWPALQSTAYATQLADLRRMNKALIDGIRTVSGADVIVDSSKTPSQAYMLSEIGGVELSILQLVRDSRAVAFSWQRKVVVPDQERGNRDMARMTPLRSALDWNVRHLLLNTLRKMEGSEVKSYDVIRYEDFVEAPDFALLTLVKRMGLSFDSSAIFESRCVAKRTHVTHTLEGNPSKFRSGNIEIRSDTEWKRGMNPLSRSIVSVLTAPYLAKFGYLRLF